MLPGQSPVLLADEGGKTDPDHYEGKVYHGEVLGLERQLRADEDQEPGKRVNRSHKNRVDGLLGLVLFLTRRGQEEDTPQGIL